MSVKYGSRWVSLFGLSMNGLLFDSGYDWVAVILGGKVWGYWCVGAV